VRKCVWRVLLCDWCALHSKATGGSLCDNHSRLLCTCAYVHAYEEEHERRLRIARRSSRQQGTKEGTDTDTQARTHTCMRAHTHSRAHTDTHTHTHTHACTRIHTHAHACTRERRPLCQHNTKSHKDIQNTQDQNTASNVRPWVTLRARGCRGSHSVKFQDSRMQEASIYSLASLFKPRV